MEASYKNLVGTLKFEAPLIMNENVFENKFSKRNPEDWKMMLIKSCQLIGDIFSEKWIFLNESNFWIIKHVLCTDDFYIVLNILQGSVRQRNQDPGHQDEWPAPGSTGESCFSLWIVKVIDSLFMLWTRYLLR